MYFIRSLQPWAARHMSRAPSATSGQWRTSFSQPRTAQHPPNFRPVPSKLHGWPWWNHRPTTTTRCIPTFFWGTGELHGACSNRNTSVIFVESTEMAELLRLGQRRNRRRQSFHTFSNYRSQFKKIKMVFFCIMFLIKNTSYKNTCIYNDHWKYFEKVNIIWVPVLRYCVLMPNCGV